MKKTFFILITLLSICLLVHSSLQGGTVAGHGNDSIKKNKSVDLNQFREARSYIIPHNGYLMHIKIPGFPVLYRGGYEYFYIFWFDIDKNDTLTPGKITMLLCIPPGPHAYSEQEFNPAEMISCVTDSVTGTKVFELRNGEIFIERYFPKGEWALTVEGINKEQEAEYLHLINSVYLTKYRGDDSLRMCDSILARMVQGKMIID